MIKKSNKLIILNIMKSSEKAYSLIRQFEGLQLKACRCPAGVWTVGYGHTSGVEPGIAVTKEQAEAFLRQDIVAIENVVNAECLNLRQCQFDALVSFVFNVGGGNFRKSTLLKKIKANPDDNSIMDEFRGGCMRKVLCCLDYRNADLLR